MPACDVPTTLRLTVRAGAHGALVTLLLAVVLGAPASAQVRGPREFRPEEELDPKLAALLDRFEKAQSTTHAMAAEFRQVKEDELFSEPSTQSGRFYYTHPTDFRWEYREPEEVIVLATKDEVTQWFPAEGVLRHTDISRNRRRVFNYFGIGSDVENLRRHFDITIVENDATYPNADKIELRGKRRRVQKRLSLLEMWIDRATSLPTAIRVEMADGGTTTWEFTEMQVNPKLPDDLYVLQLPEGVVPENGTRQGDASLVIDDILGDDAEGNPQGQ